MRTWHWDRLFIPRRVGLLRRSVVSRAVGGGGRPLDLSSWGRSLVPTVLDSMQVILKLFLPVEVQVADDTPNPWVARCVTVFMVEKPLWRNIIFCLRRFIGSMSCRHCRHALGGRGQEWEIGCASLNDGPRIRNPAAGDRWAPRAPHNNRNQRVKGGHLELPTPTDPSRAHP